MKCKYLINVIEDEVNFLKNTIENPKNSKIDHERWIVNIEGIMNEFLSEYRKVSNQEKYKFMLRLIYCLSFLKNYQLIRLIPLHEIKNTIVYLNQIFKPITELNNN